MVTKQIQFELAMFAEIFSSFMALAGYNKNIYTQQEGAYPTPES